jgi:hypothetical protein
MQVLCEPASVKSLIDLKADLERKLQIVNNALELLAESDGDSSHPVLAVAPAPMRASVDVNEIEPRSGSDKMASRPTPRASGSGRVTNAEIRRVIGRMPGPFTASQVVNSVRQEYPMKELRKAKVPALLYELRTEGELRVLDSQRAGRKGFTYVKP